MKAEPDTDRPSPNRRRLIFAAVAAALPIWNPAAAKAPIAIEVWKGPACGCCKDWISHLQANGFKVTTHDTGNGEARQRLGIATTFGSCHTALVDGYAVEGHVPARELNRLLRERPVAIGLAVPAMPIGSPGMDGPEYASRKDPYDVLLLRKDGSTTVYASYR